ncbi:MAG: hypothetical protein K9H61_06320 [Bacteroidia bacterium]|nr:hypothetical protein [Bacteroidia bacterium]MCF8425287.1 hypothetical protein [Bacteroidia bacterium]MCF8446593.1 hypothetical protein [Bacteroidia bacterium]
MKTQNPIFLAIVIIGILLLFLQSLLDFSALVQTELQPKFYAVLAGARLLALMYLIYFGTFYKSLQGKIAMVFFAFLFIGTIFKIMHWNYGEEILISSSMLIALSYLFRFGLNQNKHAISWLKLAWVVLIFAVAPWIDTHGPLQKMNYLHDYLFWIILIYQSFLMSKEKLN